MLPPGVNAPDVDDAVAYWGKCYGRTLRTLASDEVIMFTQKTGSGEVGRDQFKIVTVDADGKIADPGVSVLGDEGEEAAAIKIRSFAPVETTLSVTSSQSLEQSDFAVELFGGNAYAVRLLLNMQGEDHKLALNYGSINAIANLKGAVSNTALEGENIVDGTLTLDIGSGVTVAEMPEGEVTSKALTNLTWVVAVK